MQTFGEVDCLILRNRVLAGEIRGRIFPLLSYLPNRCLRASSKLGSR